MKHKQLTSWGILVGVALIIAAFGYFATWVGDDIRYMFSFVPGKEEMLISSFSDIIESQNAHYFIQNGRYVTHCFVQVFCGIWGQTAFAIVNGIVYILFFRALIHLCGVKMSNIKGVLIVVLLGLITFQTRMTPAFQINYIWTFAFMMIFLSLFFNQHTSQWVWWKICIVGVFSLLAGNGQEALSIGLGAALIIYWLGYMKEMTVARYVMMVCFGVGALVDCLSPGTIGRAGSVVTVSSDWSQKIVQMFVACHCIRSFYFLLIVLLWKILWGHNTWRTIYKSNSFYWNAWGVLLIFNACIGFTCYNRAWFGMELLSIIIGVRLVRKECFRTIFLYVLSFVLALTYIGQIRNIVSCRMAMNIITSQYAQSKDGEVYTNLICSPLLGEWEFSEVLCAYYVPYFQNDYRKRKRIQSFLDLKYPNRKPLRIIPTCLKGKENVKINNQIIDYSSGVILAIQSKSNPAPLYVHRCISILGYKHAYEPLEIPFDETNTLCEGTYWRACLVDVDAYCIIAPYICDIDVNFGTSSSKGANLSR